MRKYEDHYDPETWFVSTETPADAYDSVFYFTVEDRMYMVRLQPDCSSEFGPVAWFELFEVVTTADGKRGWVNIRTYPATFAKLLCDTFDKSGTLAVVELLKAEGDLDA